MLAPIVHSLETEHTFVVRLLRVLALLTAALAGGFVGAGTALAIIATRAHVHVDGSVWLAGPIAAAILAPAAVGALLAWQRPRNAVAWTLLLGALSIAFAFAVEPYALVALRVHRSFPGGRWAGELAGATWPLLYAWPLGLAFLYPTGSLPSRRWRPAALLAAISIPVLIAAITLTDERLPAPLQAVENPFPRLPSAFRTIRLVAWLVLLGTLLAGTAALVRRFRRSAGIERMQLKWLAWAGLLIPFGFAVCLVGSVVIGDPEGLALVVLLAAQTIAAVAVGVALTRYRLYEIDTLINRTLVYGVVTGILAGVYVAVVAGLGVLIGRGSTWTTALATMATALAFRPLRGRVQAAVDWRFNRDRYEGLRRVRAFEEDVRRGRAAPEQVQRVVREGCATRRHACCSGYPRARPT